MLYVKAGFMARYTRTETAFKFPKLHFIHFHIYSLHFFSLSAIVEGGMETNKTGPTCKWSHEIWKVHGVPLIIMVVF